MRKRSTLRIWLGIGVIAFFGACGGASVGTGSMDASAGRPANGSERENGDAIRLPYDASVFLTEAGSAAPTLLVDAALDLPACHKEDGLCGTVVDTCCVGFTCGTTSLNPVSHCMKNCAAHSECVSGCCTPLGTSAITVCLPKQFCPSLFCRTEEQACLGELACCEGLACAVLGTTTKTSACKKVCTQQSECTTGCCAPLGTSGIQVCLPQSYCPSLFCRAEAQTCQGENPCCEGLACAVFPATSTTPATSACKKICRENYECATNCCVSLGVDAPRACLDKSYCPSAP